MTRLYLPTCYQSLVLSGIISLSVCATPVVGEEPVVADTFVLQQRYGAACLEVTTSDLDWGTCVYQEPDDSSKCYPRNRTALISCDAEKPEQLWTYDFAAKAIHSKAYPVSMCLSRMVDSVELLPCNRTIPGQVWTFDQLGLLSSAVDKDGRGSYLNLLKGDNVVIQPLQFKYVYYGQWQCFLNPANSEKVCSTLEFGDNVIWLPDSGDDQEQEPREAPEQEQEQEPEEGQIPSSGPVTWEDKPDNLYWLSEWLTSDLRLSVRESTSCLGLDLPEGCESGVIQGEQCYVGAGVVVKPCDGDDRIWRFDLVNKRLFNKLAGYSYCLTWMNQKLSLQSCFAGGAIEQKWYFARRDHRAVFDFKQLRFFSLRASYSYLKSLKAPELPPGEEFEVEYSLVPRSSPDESCGLDPVTGSPMSDCP
ncbi:RICIN domain-containing protein [Endozoicomonas gorgoniicola]|uniref:RICIN domain-containing protein n=1 Tax=Endozoicomonas gorgoniicola TaxID=1234144 RepID=A0ABT3N516_9GAMM|nr:RICIN domain-containing protein [Endozoicomonas gorgoniicola]MCW7556423.1 RICIN domain-containing protein [Endozoicomonas gorgoniicola]